MSVITYPNNRKYRKELIFVSKNKRIKIADNTLVLPVIVLAHKGGAPLCCPLYERWIYDIKQLDLNERETLRKRSLYIIDFLNFILWETDHNALYELTLNDLKSFLVSFKTTKSGEPRDPEEWSRGIGYVFEFLRNYHDSNKNIYSFAFDPAYLIARIEVKKTDPGKKEIVNRYNKLAVRPPRKLRKKYRVLQYGYLEVLIYVGLKYDRMIVLGIMLQAFAGLREGEVVNLMIGSVSKRYGGYGRIDRILIDLNDDAPYSKNYKGKKGFGRIKRYRTQYVYPDFIQVVLDELEAHEALLLSQGASVDDMAPLFINKWGKPMTVDCYCKRVKTLFLDYLLPELKRISEKQAAWAENAPYVEAYEEEYPGAHMFRHWYTMYLLTHTNLKAEEVSKWRGDTNIASMLDYIHVNSDLINAYKDSTFRFQRSLMEDINDNR